MSGFTFADGFTNDQEGWTKAMEKTIAVPSYKRFLEVTSNYGLVVVANNPNLTKVNDVFERLQLCVALRVTLMPAPN